MAVPNAPREGGGAKVLFLIVENGAANDAALIKGVAAREPNDTEVASVGVATHEDAAIFESADPVLVIAGVDGANVRKLLTDANGRLVSQPSLAFDAGGSLDHAQQATIAEHALFGAPVGHAAVATHANGQAFDPAAPVVVIGGVAGGAVGKVALDTTGRMLVAGEPTFAGTGHVNVAGDVATVLKTTTPCRLVRVKADPDNSSTIYLGGATVTDDEVAGTGGWQLAPGDEIPVPVTDVALLYINGTNGQGCSFMWFV